MPTLYVYMNGYEVGTYTQHRSGAQEFQYNGNWMEEPKAIPLSLSMPLTEKVHKGEVVYNFFDNLLPDSLDIRNRIQAEFGTTTNQAFDLLSQIGADCIGAIQLLPVSVTVDVKNISATPLDEKHIANILRAYNQHPLGMTRNEDFRISLAGAQEKAAFLWHQKRWQRPNGATPTTHIFKLPIGRIEHAGIDLSDSVENEWLCLEIIKKFGLPVPHASIETFEDIKVLVVERFDRKLADDKKWIVRQPQEDMCQAMGMASSRRYENDNGPSISAIMSLLHSAIDPDHDRMQFMKTVFLFWVLGAIDGHAKNFSLLLKPRGRFSLAPVYDVLSAYPLAESRQLDLKKIKMAMALHGNNTHYHWYDIAARHWISESQKANFSRLAMIEIMDEVRDCVDGVIDTVSSELPKDFPDHTASPIFNGIKKIKRKLQIGE